MALLHSHSTSASDKRFIFTPRAGYISGDEKEVVGREFTCVEQSALA